MVVFDEAYIEFSDVPSKMSWVMERENLIVLRTFSKCAALAGMRCGGRRGVERAGVLLHLESPCTVKKPPSHQLFNNK